MPKYLLEVDTPVATCVQIECLRSVDFESLLMLAATGIFTSVRVRDIESGFIINEIRGHCLASDARETLSKIFNKAAAV